VLSRPGKSVWYVFRNGKRIRIKADSGKTRMCGPFASPGRIAKRCHPAGNAGRAARLDVGKVWDRAAIRSCPKLLAHKKRPFIED
jgi:hypothetical protein